MWQQIANKSFGNIVMQPTDCMWNAGVVAIPNTQDGKDCEFALAICDEMGNNGVTKRLIEQYALSIALQKRYSLGEAKTGIAHYWSTKELWNKHINNFFIQAYFSQWNYETIIEQIQLFGIAKILVFQKTKSTNLRLKGIIDKVFPSKNRQYVYKNNDLFPGE